MATRTELAAAYRATAYRVFLPGGVIDLRVDAPNPRLAAWLAAEGESAWAVLTAWNPASDPRPEAENRERQAALEVALLEDGYEPYAGENLAGDGAWPAEESCFVPGLEADDALALARRFGQNALLCGVADGLPRLVWVEQKVE